LLHDDHFKLISLHDIIFNQGQMILSEYFPLTLDNEVINASFGEIKSGHHCVLEGLQARECEQVNRPGVCLVLN
jgi:hypothetical protein